jgi:Holliday junction resolvase RusA-like endonuclease
MTSSAVSFRVLGIAAAKGNMKAFPFKRKDGSLGAAVTEGTKHSKDWQLAVRNAAQASCGGVFFDGPVRVAVLFFLPRPKSAPRRVTHHVTRPDCSKLVRAVEDALTGVLWKDDSQIVDLIVRKGFAMTQPHARIVVDAAAPLEEIALEQDLFAALEEAVPL